MLAASIAEREGALVEGVCLFHEPACDIADDYAIGPGVGEATARRQAAIEALTAAAADNFQTIIGQRCLSAGWRIGETDVWESVVGAPGHLIDLVVAPAPGGDAAFRRVVERLVTQCGAPCLIVPANASTAPFRRIVIGWNGSAQAERAIHDAMDFLKAASAVEVVFVRGDGHPVEAAEAENLVRQLARHGVGAQVAWVDAKGGGAGRELLAASDAFDADLLVMGAYGRSRAAEAILGGATRKVLSDAQLAVFLSH
jgi:nucleotide-binding universal stress UspA family protein